MRKKDNMGKIDNIGDTQTITEQIAKKDTDLKLVNQIKEHFEKEREYYKDGSCCSLSEAVSGEVFCNMALDYINSLIKENT